MSYKTQNKTYIERILLTVPDFPNLENGKLPKTESQSSKEHNFENPRVLKGNWFHCSRSHLPRLSLLTNLISLESPANLLLLEAEGAEELSNLYRFQKKGWPALPRSHLHKTFHSTAYHFYLVFI